MKIIKITESGVIECIDCEFFNSSPLTINKCIHNLIGNDCSLYSLAPTTLLYKSLGSDFWNSRSYISSLTMLVDEEGYFNNNKVNEVASKIAGTIITGTALIVAIASSNNELDISYFNEEDCLFISNTIKTIFS